MHCRVADPCGVVPDPTIGKQPGTDLINHPSSLPFVIKINIIEVLVITERFFRNADPQPWHTGL